MLLPYDHAYTISASLQADGRLFPVGGMAPKLLAAQSPLTGPSLQAVVVSYWQVREHLADLPEAAPRPQDEDLLEAQQIGNPGVRPYLIAARTLSEADQALERFLSAQPWLRRIRPFDHRELFQRRGFDRPITGREWLFDLLEQQIEALARSSDGGGYVLLTADAGFGKSRFMAGLTERLQPVALHFIQREGEWHRPAAFFTALAAQVALRFGLSPQELPPPDPQQVLDTHGAADLLRQALALAAGRAGTDQRLILLLDGLDEAFGPAGEYREEFKSSLWSETLPPGVFFIISSRPEDISQLPLGQARTLRLERDQEPAWTERNQADLRTFIEARLEDIGYAARTQARHRRLVDNLLQASDGLFIVAEMLLTAEERPHAAGDDKALDEKARLVRRIRAWEADPSRIPRGLEAWIEKQWQRILDTGQIDDRELTLGLNLLLSAYRHLDDDQLDTLEELAGELPSLKTNGVDLRRFVTEPVEQGPDRASSRWRLLLRLAGNLFEPARGDGPRRYRLRHATFEEAARARLTRLDPQGRTRRKLHCFWAFCCQGWNRLDDRDPFRAYALGHLPRHALAAGEPDMARQALEDIALEGYLHNRLQSQERAGRIEIEEITELVSDYQRLLEARPEWAGGVALPSILDDLRRVFGQKGHFLGQGEPLAQWLYNALARDWDQNTPFGKALRQAAWAWPGPWIEELDPKPLDRSLLRTLTGHTDSITQLVYWPKNPDQREAAEARGAVTELIVTASRDGTARIYAADTGKCLHVLEEHSGSIDCLDISPDGTRIATGCRVSNNDYDVNPFTGGPDVFSFLDDHHVCHDDYIVRLWEVESGQCLKVLEGHSDHITTLAFSPDGACIATGSWDQTARLWEVESGQCRKVLEGHSDRITTLAFSPDGAHLVTGCNSQVVNLNARLWETDSGRCIKVLEGDSSWLNTLAFSPDGACIATGSWGNTARLWDVDSGQCLAVLEGHSSKIKTLAFSPDGTRLATGSCWDHTARLWEVDSGRCLAVLKAHSGEITTLAFSPDGKLLATGADDYTICLWDTDSGRCLKVLKGHSGEITTLAFSPDGKLLTTGADDYTTRLWDTNSGRLLTLQEGHLNSATALAFKTNEKCPTTGSEDHTARPCELDPGQHPKVKVLEGHSKAIITLAFSPDGKRLATRSMDQTARLWEADTGRCLKVLGGDSETITTLAFSPNGARLATGSLIGGNSLFNILTRNFDHSARLWEAGSGRCLAMLEGHSDKIITLAFSPDGSRLATGSWDHTVRLWEVNSGQLLVVLEGHSDWITALAFSPDGGRIAAGCRDHIASLWEVESGQCLAVLEGHWSPIETLAFSPDGSRLATGTWRDTYLWEVDSGRLLKVLKGHSDPFDTPATSPDGSLQTYLASGELVIADMHDRSRRACWHHHELVDLVFPSKTDAPQILVASIDFANHRSLVHPLHLHNLPD